MAQVMVFYRVGLLCSPYSVTAMNNISGACLKNFDVSSKCQRTPMQSINLHSKLKVLFSNFLVIFEVTNSVGKFLGTLSQDLFNATYRLSPMAVNFFHSTLQTKQKL